MAGEPSINFEGRRARFVVAGLVCEDILDDGMMLLVSFVGICLANGGDSKIGEIFVQMPRRCMVCRFLG